MGEPKCSFIKTYFCHLYRLFRVFSHHGNNQSVVAENISSGYHFFVAPEYLVLRGFNVFAALALQIGRWIHQILLRFQLHIMTCLLSG